MFATQIITECKTPEEAERILQVLLEQEGCMGGRILLPSPTKSQMYRVQTFHEDMGPDSRIYPDGCRRVALLSSFVSALRKTR